MKKTIMTILLCAALTGCSAEGAASLFGKEEAAAEQVTTAAPNNYTKRADDATVTGEVLSVTGNEVTLALGETEKRERPDTDKGERPEFSDGERPDFTDGERPDFGSGERPDFGDGERPDFGDNEKSDREDSATSSEDKSASSDSRRKRRGTSIKKTGEEETYIIPVGMTIDGLSGRNTDYSGISAGMILTLTINSDGVVCAATVE